MLGTNIDDYLVEPNTILKESFRANVSATVQVHTLVKKDYLVDIPEINEHIAWRCGT
ncbi:hypothetical protein MUP77_01575 [Candidatus Bathyarchaeota archaeon]|nr:hypothetical protein [Candidatus Bathyarchaeota archaeon]